ncbi:unnamed protein product, partial [Nesidiocoris tenuis]
MAEETSTYQSSGTISASSAGKSAMIVLANLNSSIGISSSELMSPQFSSQHSTLC